MPSSFFPAASRAAGVSMPWSTEFRMIWVSGSVRRSMIERSTSVV
jgi:hypothetical protein